MSGGRSPKPWDERARHEWFRDVVRAWNEHWKGTDHRYGHDFAAFLGERFQTDFGFKGPHRR